MNERAEFVKKQREQRRQETLNRTWRNPRYYVVFLVLPVALPLAAIPWLFELLSRALAAAEERTSDTLRWLWGPLERWIRRGARKTPEVRNVRVHNIDTDTQNV